MNKILEVTNLTKKFGKFTAVNDISFNLAEGEILGFLGPNGAGKTTTIQMLLSVLTPTSGKVEYFGKDLKTHRSEILDRVNYSSSYTSLPLDLTVLENLTFVSYLYSIKNRKKRIDELIEMFKLEKLLDQPTKELSSGQTTRVNLAKSFLNNPEVLLLDEPTASLDPDVAQNMRELLKKHRKQSNTSIVFTSHNMAEVEEMCDRVIFLSKGKIEANDTPDNLAHKIKSSHIQLMFEGKEAHASKIIKANGFKSKVDGNYVIVQIKEDQIAKLLRTLAKEDLEYTEISISKPSLEDYFLSLAQERNESA